MVDHSTAAGDKCPDCGSELTRGPFGQRCARCVLLMVAEQGDDEELRVAELFPELILEEQVGCGGFGAVYRAEHRRMKRPVALKFLNSILSRSPEAVALFEQEMITVGKLDHPGIVRAHDAGERDGNWYLIMEFVDGMDCGALVRLHQKLPMVESCEIVRQAALALHHAHGEGLVHRDVKPGNLIVSRLSADVKVLDFGLAGIAVEPVIKNPEAVEDHEADQRFLGTLDYIAPEQIATPDHVDARADIYALGATLRRLLTGKPSREGMSEQTLVLQMKVVTSMPVAPIRTLCPDLPEKLALICDRLLEFDPNDRPATAAEVAELLKPWSEGAELVRLFEEGPLPEKAFVKPRRIRRRFLAAAAVLVSGAMVTALVHKGEKEPVTPTPAALQGQAILTEEAARLRGLDLAQRPRVLLPGWTFEREVLSQDPVSEPVRCARIRPDGRIIYVRYDYMILGEKTIGDQHIGAHSEMPVTDCGIIGVQPGTGNLVWGSPGNSNDLAIHRLAPDGRRMKPLAPDFSAEESEEGRAAMKKYRDDHGVNEGNAYPWGFAFVTEGNVPPDSGLQPGDVIYADEGHRELALYDRLIFPRPESKPGLWKFRFDSDDPPQRLGSLSPLWIEGFTHFPLDTAVSKEGVFLLNRTDTGPKPEIIPSDYTSRILRLESGKFRKCQTDLPIHRPNGLAADPLSSDLYVLNGGADLAPGKGDEQILRLRPSGKDHYAVEVFASGFMTLGACGLQITEDGQRMVVTDERLAAVMILKRDP